MISFLQQPIQRIHGKIDDLQPLLMLIRKTKWRGKVGIQLYSSLVPALFQQRHPLRLWVTARTLLCHCRKAAKLDLCLFGHTKPAMQLALQSGFLGPLVFKRNVTTKIKCLMRKQITIDCVKKPPFIEHIIQSTPKRGHDRFQK